MSRAPLTDLAALEDIPRLGALRITAGGIRIAVFRTGSDTVYGLEDRCPHKGGPLSDGMVHGSCVTCPLHDWTISLETGRAQGADTGRVRTFRTEIRDGRVLIDLTELVTTFNAIR